MIKANHIITRIVSGSWKETSIYTHEGGKILTSNPEDMEEETFIEAECSCGEKFTSDDEIQEHLKELREE